MIYCTTFRRGQISEPTLTQFVPHTLNPPNSSCTFDEEGPQPNVVPEALPIGECFSIASTDIGDFVSKMNIVAHSCSPQHLPPLHYPSSFPSPPPSLHTLLVGGKPLSGLKYATIPNGGVVLEPLLDVLSSVKALPRTAGQLRPTNSVPEQRQVRVGGEPCGLDQCCSLGDGSFPATQTVAPLVPVVRISAGLGLLPVPPAPGRHPRAVV